MDIKSLSPARKVYYNVLTQGVLQVTSMAIGLILPRFILSAYGSEYNGIVLSITQFLAFIGVLRLGVAGATRVALYKTLANGDVVGTSGIVKATEEFMQRIAYIIVVYVLFLLLFFPWYIDSSYSWLEISTLVLAIGAGTFAEYYFGITYITLLDSAQLTFISTGLRFILSLLNVTSVVLLIVNGYSIQIVKITSAIIFAISPMLLSYYVPRIFGLNKTVEADYSALKQRYDVMASSVANIVHENTAIFVLTLLTNPLVVSVYAIYALVTSGLRQILNVFTTGLEAYFGDMWAKGNISGIKAALSHYEYFISCFISIVYTCAFVLIIPFIKLYTEGVHDIEYILPTYAFLALLAEMLFCIRAPYLTLVQAAGKYKETKHGSYVEAGLNIIISIIGTLSWGIIGVAIGTLSANLFRTVQYSKFICDNMLDVSMFRMLNKFFWLILNVVISTMIVKWRIDFDVVGWYGFFIVSIETIVISTMVVVATSVLFWKNEFKWLLNRFVLSKICQN